jgi:hypothetical protein
MLASLGVRALRVPTSAVRANILARHMASITWQEVQALRSNDKVVLFTKVRATSARCIDMQSIRRCTSRLQ